MKNNKQDKFLWGVATSSLQIEGAHLKDGKTLNIWDAAPEKKIKNGDNCHTSTNHYDLYEEDVDHMKQMGVNSYRFSLSWSRIIPEEGKVNQLGIDFYNRLINRLIEKGIEPLITIFHWDLPMWVHEKGGWLSNSIIDLFGDYVKVVAESFSDRVKYWFVYNEPQCFIFNGYVVGSMAPFKKNIFNINKASRIALKAHGVGVKKLRDNAKQPVKIGIAMAAGSFIPKSPNKKDIDKARYKTFNSTYGKLGNRWWGDPILAGKPVTAFGVYKIRQKDIDKSFQKLDFIGINTYAPFVDNDNNYRNFERTDLNWIIDERVLYWTTKFFFDRYHMPIIISENGCAFNDIVVDNQVHDNRRIDFINRYVESMKAAINDGVPIFGYMHWSLLDNFEWSEGYYPRFGLVHVDYLTLKRTIKDSGYHYRDIIQSNQNL